MSRGEEEHEQGAETQDVERIALWFDIQAVKERELLDSGRCRPDARALVIERWLVYKASALSVRTGAWSPVLARKKRDELDELRSGEALRKLVHPDGDAIEIDAIDNDLIGLTVKQGPHEICQLAFTGVELDALIDRLQRARRKVPL